MARIGAWLRSAHDFSSRYGYVTTHGVLTAYNASTGYASGNLQWTDMTTAQDMTKALGAGNEHYPIANVWKVGAWLRSRTGDTQAWCTNQINYGTSSENHSYQYSALRHAPSTEQDM